MIRTVVACITYVVVIAVILILICFVRAVVLVVGNTVAVTVESGGLADITFRSCRVVIFLVGIGMIRTVVACITYVVTVRIFLVRVRIVRAVVKVIENTVAVAVESSHRAYGCILVCIGMIRTVVACITDMVTVCIFLKRVEIERAVVLEVFKIVKVRVNYRFFTDITDVVPVAVLLIGVGVLRTVVACITDIVAVCIFLSRICNIRAVVEIIFNTVAVYIYRFRCAGKGILGSVRVVRAAVACIADTVVIFVFLVRVVVIGAVVFEVFDAVAVAVDESGLACITGPVSVLVLLIVVRMERTVVTEIASAVTVCIVLIRILYVRTVVERIFNTVAVRVYRRSFTCIADAVSVRVFLVGVRIVGTVVAFIADTVSVAVLLAVSRNRGAEVNAVHYAVFVTVDIGNTAAADSRFGLVEIIRTIVNDIAVRFFVVLVGFRFFRLRVWVRLNILNIFVISCYGIGKIFFVRFFRGTVTVRNDCFRICCFFAAGRERENEKQQTNCKVKRFFHDILINIYK